MLPYPTVNLSQYGDSLIRYVGHKQGHVTQINMFVFYNHNF